MIYVRKNAANLIIIKCSKCKRKNIVVYVNNIDYLWNIENISYIEEEQQEDCGFKLN